MTRVNPQLLQKLKDKLNLSRSRVYDLIDMKVSETLLDRRVAALAVARDKGIRFTRFATADDLAALRQHGTVAHSASPAPSAPSPRTLLPTPRISRATRMASKGSGSKDTVFVIHGRNKDVLRALHEFLRSLHLKPIEWNKAIQLSGRPSAHISTIVDAAIQKATALVVLLTPDDEVRLRKRHWKKGESSVEKTLTPQARPNVLFEAGLAFGRKPNATILVEVGRVKSFSDVAGRHVLHLGNEPEVRREFITKLRNAGCDVDDDGSDWLNAGDFSIRGT